MLGEIIGEIIWDQNSIAIVCVIAIPIVAIVGGLWASVEKRRSDNELKHSMVERGMSAEEIERVISAKVKG